MNKLKYEEIESAAESLCNYCDSIDMEAPDCSECMVVKLANNADAELSKSKMNKIVNPESIISVIGTFCSLNAKDESTVGMLLAVGADLLGVSVEDMRKLVSKDS